MKISLIPIALVIPLMVCSISFAEPLPYYSGQISWHSNGLDFQEGGGADFRRTPGSSIIPSSADVGYIANIAQPVPSLSVLAKASGDLNNFTTAISRFSYSYFVEGPASDVLVPINLSGNYSLNFTGQSSGFGRVNVDGAAGQFSRQFGPFDSSSNSAGTFSGQVMAFAGQYYEVVLYENAFARLGTASVFIDPFFSIDDSFANINPGYSLSVSTGIGNADPNAVFAVPEPESWSLVLFGLVAVGLFAKRRKIASS